eukprot:2502150-Amphidinium_carterae.1
MAQEVCPDRLIAGLPPPLSTVDPPTLRPEDVPQANALSAPLAPPPKLRRKKNTQRSRTQRNSSQKLKLQIF